MPELLSNETADQKLESIDGWTREGDEISRTFEFEDFSESMGFVVRVGMAAEEAGHHPDIDIRWNKVTLVLSTHSEGGLTEMDLDLAKATNQLA